MFLSGYVQNLAGRATWDIVPFYISLNIYIELFMPAKPTEAKETSVLRSDILSKEVCVCVCV